MKRGAVNDLPGGGLKHENSLVTSDSAALIVGYGNRLRGDDALGPEVVERLSRRFAADPRVETEIVPQLTLELAETIAKYELVVFVDARQDEPTGRLAIEPVQPSYRLPQAFSHYFRPEELLGICTVVYGGSPKAVLATISTDHFEVGESISPEASKSIATFIDRIEAYIQVEIEVRSNAV